MRIGNKGIELIKSFEGCRLQAYYCPSGVLTIGWGHTGNVYEGQTITQAQADQLFIEDVKRYEPGGTWNQNQFDALTSFSYNCGVGAMQSVINSGNITGEMALYINGSNGVLEGLRRRRKAEIELFNTPVKTENKPTDSSIIYDEDGIFTFTEVVSIRNAAMENARVGGQYEIGEEVIYRTVILNKNGFNWIVYNRNNGELGYLKIKDLSTGESYGSAR